MTQAFNLSQLANNVNTSGQLDASAGLYNTTPAANGGTGRSTLTSGSVLLGNGTSAVTMLAGAVTNDILSWNGTTWASVPVASTGASGNYVYNKYTSPTSWTKPATLKAVKVTVVAGGGGATGIRYGTNAPFAPGGGASQAGYAYFPAASLPASPITVTVGTGGTGGASPGGVGGTRTAGSPGTSSSFGSLITATAGGGGPATNNAPAGTNGTWSSPAPASNQFLYDEPPAVPAYFTANYRCYGRSTGGAMGQGGEVKAGGFPAPTGNTGGGYGSGGGGFTTGPSADYGRGGDGADGIIIIEEFY